jgi:multidrug efflux pump subunit AcrB
VAVSGRDLDSDRAVADKVRLALAAIPGLRDVQFGQPFRYPTVDVTVDREKAGIRGVRVADVGKSIIAVTASSAFVSPNYWTDPRTGASYMVQVEVPEGAVKSIRDLRNVPVDINGGALPLSDFASVTPGVQVAEYDRLDMQRMATVTGNLFGTDLGHASGLITRALAPIRASLPRGTDLLVRGQVATLGEMTGGLSAGLGFAIVVILLLLAGSFESLSLAFIIIFNVTAVLAGALTVLYCTGASLNIESFMGTIMSIGVSVANAVLLITFADQARRSGHDSWKAAVHGAQSRLRPILMTAIAMIVGMIPMALGLSESGKQTAPLARAVIGGLMGSTITTLLLMPVVYAMAFHDKPIHTASLDPFDPQSANFEKEAK